MSKAKNFLGVGGKEVGCVINGKTFTLTTDELDEIITLYDAVRNDYIGRKLAFREEDGRIQLV